MSEYRYKLPDVGEGVVEAEIVEWRIATGDRVIEDQHILDVMTDKATVEIPCAVNGVVKSIVGEPGEVIAVGTEILVIEVDGAAPAEDSALKAEPAPAPEAPGTEPRSEPESVPVAIPASVASKAPVRPAGGRPLASPAVRQRALEVDIDLDHVPGTGPAGRITHADLDDFIAAGGRLISQVGGAASGYVPRTGVEDIKVIGLRRKIAESMARSKRTIPHITYVDEIDLTTLDDLRAHMNVTRKDNQPKLTIIPFLIRALVKALPDFPQANATFDTETGVLTRYEGVHCGIAAATSNGLMVPVVRHAETLDIWRTAIEVKRLGDAAKAGKCTKEELTGSTITITSLGAIGGIVTTPVINHPETAIIGVNKMQTLPRYDREGRVLPRKIMNLSSSFDHRIVDGYEAAQLIQTLKALLENPATLFMD